MVVEVTEESDEAERVGQDDHVHGVREVTVGKQVVRGVDCYYEKLELGGREIGMREKCEIVRQKANGKLSGHFE